MNDMVVRLLKQEELGMWDDFVEKSSQGTIFEKSSWINNMARNLGIRCNVYAVCDNSGNIAAGVPVYILKRAGFKVGIYPPLTPYMGIMFGKFEQNRAKEENMQVEIVKAFTQKLSSDFSYVRLSMHPTIGDARPFKWAGWETDVAYTYYSSLNDRDKVWQNMGRDAKKNIKKSEEYCLEFHRHKDVGKFYEMYEKTYTRQKMKAPVPRRFIEGMFDIFDERSIAMYFAEKNNEPAASCIVLFYKNASYYLLAASDYEKRQFKGPSFLLWKVLEDVSKSCTHIDLVGANTPSVVEFKNNFSTSLVPYIVASKASTKSARLMANVYSLLSKFRK